MDSPITILRRKRVRVRQAILSLKTQLAGYHAKLADLQAQIDAISPELDLPQRPRKWHSVFGHGEWTRLVLTVLREAGEPLSIQGIVVRMLAMKGITLPDPTLQKDVRKRLRIAFAAMDKRGVTVRVEDGRESRRVMVTGRTPG
jgi:hypothetical protein